MAQGGIGGRDGGTSPGGDDSGDTAPEADDAMTVQGDAHSLDKASADRGMNSPGGTADQGATADGAPDGTDERLLAGRYLLGEVLGSGGMGKVWQATDQLLGRQVAVKELKVTQALSRTDLATLHQRMKQEARAAARVNHPGVVTVHDVLEQDGRPWIVMELVEGRSLADVIGEEGTLLPRNAASVGLKVLEALRAAHDAGVQHRDVKPGNVLLARDGRVLLTDFGIATLEGGTSLTRTGDVVGSPDYLAPERAMGRRPGPESDLWSLGATLYTAVEGQSPFRRTSALSTLQAVVTEEPPEPRHAGALAPVLLTLLRKDPHERPSHDETGRMLQEVADGGSVAVVDDSGAYIPTQVGGPPLTQPGPPPPIGQQPPQARRTQALPQVPMPFPGQERWHTPPTSYAVPGGSGAPGVHDGRVGRRGWPLLIAAVVAASLVGGGVAVAALTQDDAKPPDTRGSGESPQSKESSSSAKDQSKAKEQPTPPTPRQSVRQDQGGSGQPSGNGDTGGQGGSGEGSPDTEENPEVPPGYRWVNDPAGFSMAVPQGWTRQVNNGQIDYTPDGGVHLLRIGTISSATESAYSHFLALEGDLSKRFQSYKRLRLAETTYQDRPAAVWEFTWTSTKTPTGPRHAIDQGYVAENGTEYDLYASSPAADWGSMSLHFQTLLDTWRLRP